MAKSNKVHPKKKRGRPATGKDPLVSARLPQPLIDQVKEWSASNSVSRSEAIRRLVEIGLKGETPTKAIRTTPNKLRAQELAARAIEKMTDPAAPPDERAQRRRRRAI